MGGTTLGYTVAAQGPDGLIHLITSRNPNSLHFSFNEAWLTAPADADAAIDTRTQPDPPAISGAAETREERYPNGGPVRARWTVAAAANGRLVLQGEDGRLRWTVEHRADVTSVWTQYWPNGKKRTESTWEDLRAIGTATAWDAAGKETGRATFPWEPGKSY